MKQKIKFHDFETEVIVKNPAERIQSHWAKGAFYEANRNQLLQAIWANRDRFNLQGKEILDIGGNVGNHAIWFALVFGAKVVTYEPVQRLYNHLLANIAAAGMVGQVSAIHAAAGASLGWAIMQRPVDSKIETGGDGMHQVRPANKGDKNAVRILPIDADPIASPAFIKIDVEGFEMEVLRGGEQTIRQSRPIISVEVSPENRPAFDVWMKENGYSILIPFILNYGTTVIIEPK